MPDLRSSPGIAKRRLSWAAAAAAVVCVLVVGWALVVGPSWFRELVRKSVVEQAEARGIAIEFREHELSVASVWPLALDLELEGARLSFTHPSAFRVELPTVALRARVEGLSAVTLEAVRAREATVVVERALADFLAELDHPDRLLPRIDVPFTIEQLTFHWRSETGHELLSFDAASLDVAPGAAGSFRVRAERGAFLGQPLEATELAWVQGSLKAKSRWLPIAGARADVELALTERGHLDLSTDVAEPQRLISAWFGSTERIERATVKISGERAATGWGGQAVINLIGFVPPHPIELDGFDFGKNTLLTSGFSLAPPYRHLELTNLQLHAGLLRLVGKASLERRGLGSILEHVAYHADLAGALSCSDVAAHAIRARTDSVFSKFFARSATLVVKGRVGIGVAIEGRWPSLAPPSVTRTVSPGCGIRRLSEIEVERVYRTLPALARDLPDPSAVLEQFKLPDLGKLPPPAWPDLQPD